MRLSESIRKNIMEAGVGGIINKFKVKKRRFTLFFEDILANYIKVCEEAGYEEEMRKIGELWGALGKILISSPIRKLPLHLFSRLSNKIWTSIGIMEYFEIKKRGNRVYIITKKDTITRIIGGNNFAVGCFKGISTVKFNFDLVPIKISQNKETSKYIFKITKKAVRVEGKNKEEYNRLNTLPSIKGHTLKDAIKKNVFQLRGNRIYFRGKSICNSENTLFHIIGNRDILLDRVPKISYNYFNQIVSKNTEKEKKLLLLKTFLQTMGWGIVKIKIKNKSVIMIEISYLPCGLQLERENYDFLIKTILGYLWVIDKRFKIGKVTLKSRCIILEYRKG